MDINTKQRWDDCFNQFKLLEDNTKLQLRRIAAEVLIKDGFEEVGSSDINHSLFSMWQVCSCDWVKVTQNYSSEY